MVAISYRNGVSIGEIVVYVPALAMAALLAIRHGFRSGFFFLLVFSLARVIGPCLELAATMGDHIQISLLTGSAILQNIGLSPLMMTALAFLSRVLAGITKNLGQPSFPTAKHLRFIQVILSTGLLLGIAGGVKASEELQKTGRCVPPPVGKVAIALFISVYILIVLVTVLTSCTNLSHADSDEKSLLLAVAMSLPFLLLRVIFSSISSFDSETLPNFNQVSGSVTVWLCMAVIMEMIVVLIYESVGLTLHTSEGPDESPSSGGGLLGRLIGHIFAVGRRTIIGRLIAAACNADDEERQRPRSPSVR
ncbi:unnamed protein product [Calypogeia fissa]